MRENDPLGLRKAAAQAIIPLLSSNDLIAVAQYASDAETLTPGWVRPRDRGQLLNAIGKAGDQGRFTDFRAALEHTLAVYEDVPPSEYRRVVMFLTDGILDPDPTDAAYAPYHLEYPARAATANRAERRALNAEFRDRLRPIARRLIENRLVPALKDSRIEILTVGLGGNVEPDLLDFLARATTRDALEVHSYYARTPEELIEAFLAFIEYWTNILLLTHQEGVLSTERRQRVYIDQFVNDPQLLVLADTSARVALESPDGRAGTRLENTHPNLTQFRLSQSAVPGEWILDFDAGVGHFDALWLGRSELRLTLEGLEDSYGFGDTVSAEVTLRIGDDFANRFLAPGPRIYADIFKRDGSLSRIERLDLASLADTFRFDYVPPTGGSYQLQFIAVTRAFDGSPILPRPSVRYQVMVNPALVVFPERLNFGEADAGSRVRQRISIRSGFEEPIIVTAGSELTYTSRQHADLKESNTPNLRRLRVHVEPQGRIDTTVVLDLPGGTPWGDYEGRLTFRAPGAQDYIVPFRVHLPSLWERLTLPVLGLLLLVLAILAYLVYVWGLLPTPSGVLIPVEVPPGDSVRPQRLSELRRGLLTRYLNWRRHLVRIGASEADIQLKHLPADLEAQLAFTRFGKTYLRNLSDRESGHVIEIEEPNGIKYGIRSGSRLSLIDMARIHVGDYVFRFQKRYGQRRGNPHGG